MNRRLRFSPFAVALATAALLPSIPADAATYSNGTATATMLVSLTVQAACSITANPLNFGSSTALTSVVDQQSTLSVTCATGTPYNIGLNLGTVSGSTSTSRLMAGITAGNTSTVAFELYRDSGHANIWGNTQGTDTVGGTGTGSAQTVPVYGEVSAQTTPQPDTYQSTVTAPLFF